MFFRGLEIAGCFTPLFENQPLRGCGGREGGLFSASFASVAGG